MKLNQTVYFPRISIKKLGQMKNFTTSALNLARNPLKVIVVLESLQQEYLKMMNAYEQ